MNDIERNESVFINEKNKKMKALKFAILAHDKQYRKAEPSIPYVTHPISVASILENNQADEDMIVAGLLHDIVEDTCCTFETITKYFGMDVSKIVDYLTEHDKKETWEERKKKAIQVAKQAPVKVKEVIAADKLSNIIDINIAMKSKGDKVFDRFNRDKEHQEWYYRNMYSALESSLNIESNILKELLKNINEVFGRTMEDYINDNSKLVI